MARTRATSRTGTARMPRLKGVKLEGPFFEGDPAKKFRANVKDFMDRVADVGEAEAKARINAVPRQHQGARTSSSFIRGRTRALTGKEWAVTAVVSPVTQGMSRAEAISVRARVAVIERRGHPIRQTKNAIRRLGREAAKTLLKGL